MCSNACGDCHASHAVLMQSPALLLLRRARMHRGLALSPFFGRLCSSSSEMVAIHRIQDISRPCRRLISCPRTESTGLRYGGLP